MVVASYIGIVIFLVLLLSMSLTAGTQPSISQLAKQWRWLLLVALLSQVLLLPQMLEITPNGWQFLAFIGISGVVFCGGANLFDKADYWVHIIAAAITFTALTGWVMAIDARLLLPLAVCLMAGRDRLVWRAEVGLIASVYLAILLNSLPG